MTREEAIEIIKQDIPCEHDTDLIEALYMAIEALREPRENKEKMTWETMNEFRSYICVTCKSNDWYCPTDCDFLEKAKRYPIERINKAFMDCEEDVVKLCRRIKSWK